MACTTNKREDFRLESYEGLVHSTARKYEDPARKRGVELEDFEQILRIKVWWAIEHYSLTSDLPVRRFVFGCLTNQVKDVLKRKRNQDAHLEDMMGASTTGSEGEIGADSTRNALRYLSVSEEDTFADLLDELPNTLTEEELHVAEKLIAGWQQYRIAEEMQVSLGRVRAHIAALRLKLGARSRELFDHDEPLAA